MPVQRTLILLKPDAVQRGLAGEILARFERKGLRIAALQYLRATAAMSKQHYAEHVEKPFYPSLEKFITSGALVAVCLEGDEAVAACRNLIGATDGRKAAPGTIRGDFSLSRSSNLVHGSDSPEAATRELAIWFPAGVVGGSRTDTAWVEGD